MRQGCLHINMKATLLAYERSQIMKTAAIILLVVGLLMTLYTGFGYVTQDKVLDMGNLEMTIDDHHSAAWTQHNTGGKHSVKVRLLKGQ